MTTIKKGLIFSDVHLGGKRTSTVFIKDNLSKYIFDDIRRDPPDFVVTLGDLTDTALQYSSDDAIEVTAWMCELLDICYEFGISLKVLEGTPSHDAGQNIWFMVENNKRPADKRVDVFYGDKLCIEHDSKLGLDILYVPDKLNFDATDTWFDVLALMKSRGLEKLDYIFMHGSFPHQMPKSPSVHDPDRYIGVCKYLVFAGHVHQHSVYEGKLIVPGSFDRDRHLDETAKGFLRVHGDSWHFVENKGAKVYKTIDVRKLPLDIAIKTIRDDVESNEYREGSYIRIHYADGDEIATVLETLKDINRAYTWSSIKELNKPMLIEELTKPFEDNAITISPSNISDLLLERLSLNGNDLDLYNRLMGRLLDGYI